MDYSPAAVFPFELWVNITLTLRDSFLCIHGIDGKPCLQDKCPSLKSSMGIRPLSETCHFLRGIVQPILYASVNLNVPSWGGLRRLTSLSSTLSARPDLRLSIRSLELVGIDPGSHCDALLKVVPLLVNVQFLSLKSIIVTMAIVELLLNATQLHTLHMSDFQWAEDVPEAWSEGGLHGRNIKKLELDGWEAIEVNHVGRTSQLLFPGIEELKASPQLIRKVKNSPSYLSFGHSLVRLDTWTTNPDSKQTLYELLSRSPKIEELHAQGGIDGLDFNEAFLPKLLLIDANMSLVTALLPGRPIRSITAVANLDLFLEPLPNLEVLNLRWFPGDESGLNVITALLAACPGLIRLELRSDGDDSGTGWEVCFHVSSMLFFRLC